MFFIGRINYSKLEELKQEASSTEGGGFVQLSQMEAAFVKCDHFMERP